MLGSRRLRIARSARLPDVPVARDTQSLPSRTDPIEFAALYEELADPIFRFCYRRLGDRSAAEDATSQVFTKALAALPRFRGGSARAWLFAIAANVVVDTYRTGITAAPLDHALEIADAAPNLEQRSIDDEQRHALRRAMTRLPASQRSIVELRLAGLNSPEIAAALGMTITAVKSAQTRAYARLRDLLHDDLAHEKDRA